MSHGQYATEADWDAWHAVDREAEWSTADIKPLVSYVKATARRVAEDLGVAIGDLQLLELGCGGSGLAPALQEEGLQVQASDFSPTVIAHMTAAYPAVQWLVADARNLPLPSGSVHVVFAKTLVDCLRTQPKSGEVLLDVLREARRVLLPRGRLVFMDKMSSSIHWDIRAPAPVELLPVVDGPARSKRRRWFCHELRARQGGGEQLALADAVVAEGEKADTTSRGAANEVVAAVPRRCDDGLELQDSFRALVVKSSSNDRLLAGDRVLEVNGLQREVRGMRRSLRRQGSAVLKVQRELLPGWCTLATVKIGEKRSVLLPQVDQAHVARHVARQREARTRSFDRGARSNSLMTLSMAELPSDRTAPPESLRRRSDVFAWFE
eukprot:TRINITY_DN57052_c0_g1_i1.p1 TRINITY_DN57052_c0_g1~~TRINITY_DN57052_c0_g1_i1.p1  ORF type:complete len:380 (+),score=80.06 TRINITY_DN57052_c0_g1_i1:140-1279(+)